MHTVHVTSMGSISLLVLILSLYLLLIGAKCLTVKPPFFNIGWSGRKMCMWVHSAVVE